MWETLPPVTAPQDIRDGVGTREGRAALRGHVEFPKAMKQVRPADLPRLSRDTIVRPRQRHAGPQTAIHGDLGQADSTEAPEEHGTTQE
jgi:hypothetical protein